MDDVSTSAGPGQYLPAELLGDIFLCCIYSYPAGYDNLHPSRPPWTLPQVCRHWRAAALSTPHLWAALPRLNTNAAPARLRKFLRLSLERSAPCTFSLHLTAYLEEPSAAPVNLPLLDELCLHMNRCAELTLLANAHVIPQLARLTARLPALHTLAVRFVGRFRDFAVHRAKPAPALDFGADCAPHLQHFAVEAPAHTVSEVEDVLRGPVVLGWVRAPWAQLVTVAATSVSTAYLLAVLTHARRVHTVTVAGTWGQAAPVGGAPLVLPALRAFNVRAAGGMWAAAPAHERARYPATACLDQLCAPNLVRLTLEACRADDAYAAEVVDFWRRSACGATLTTLAVHAADGGAQLASLLAAAPSLRTLAVGGVSGEQLALLRLTTDAGTPGPVPRLRDLTLVAPSASADDIFFLLMSRKFEPVLGGEAQPLETLVLRFDVGVGSTAGAGRRGEAEAGWQIYYALERWDGLPRKDRAFQAVLSAKRALEHLRLRTAQEQIVPTKVATDLDKILTPLEADAPTPARYLSHCLIVDVVRPLADMLRPSAALGEQGPAAHAAALARLEVLHAQWVRTLADYHAAPRWVLAPSRVNPTHVVYRTGCLQALVTADVGVDADWDGNRGIDIEEVQVQQLPGYFRESRRHRF